MQCIAGLDDDVVVHSPVHKRARTDQKQHKEQPSKVAVCEDRKVPQAHPLSGHSDMPCQMDSFTRRERLTVGQLRELNDLFHDALAEQTQEADWFVRFVSSHSQEVSVPTVPDTAGFTAIVQAFAALANDEKHPVAMLPPLMRIIFDYAPDTELPLPPLHAALTFGLGLVPVMGPLIPAGPNDLQLPQWPLRMDLLLGDTYKHWCLDDIKHEADVLDVIISQTMATNRGSLGSLVPQSPWYDSTVMFAEVVYPGAYADVPMIHIRNVLVTQEHEECGVYLCPGCYSRLAVQRIDKKGPLLVTKFFGVDHFPWCSNKRGIDAIVWQPQRTLTPWFRVPTTHDLAAIFRRGSHQVHNTAVAAFNYLERLRS